MCYELRNEPYNPWQELARFENEQIRNPEKSGAASIFVGTMRDHNEGAQVTSMFLDHYPGMAERYLKRIDEEAHAQWRIANTLILHRTDLIIPGQTIVLIAVWSTHRGAAFEACRFLIENLKSKAPFWKKETLLVGSRWVEKNTPYSDLNEDSC